VCLLFISGFASALVSSEKMNVAQIKADLADVVPEWSKNNIISSVEVFPPKID
jgi:hypothetical protein